MKRLRDRRLTPSCGWVFQCPDTGYAIRADSFEGLVSRTEEHLVANHKRLPVDLDLVIEDHIASRIDPRYTLEVTT